MKFALVSRKRDRKVKAPPSGIFCYAFPIYQNLIVLLSSEGFRSVKSDKINFLDFQLGNENYRSQGVATYP